jgi:hypothetical protein
MWEFGDEPPESADTSPWRGPPDSESWADDDIPESEITAPDDWESDDDQIQDGLAVDVPAGAQEAEPESPEYHNADESAEASEVDDGPEEIRDAGAEAALSAFADKVGKEGLWEVAAIAADAVHPGGRIVVEWAYQAVKLLRVAAGINSGRGFDLKIGVFETDIDGLLIAYRLRQFSTGDGALPRGGFGFDVSFIDPLTVGRPDFDGTDHRDADEVQVAGRWFDYLGPLAAVDHALVLDLVRVLPAGEALDLLSRISRYQTSLAFGLALDPGGESGGCAYTYQGVVGRDRWDLRS